MVKVIGPLASHHASGRMSAPRVYSSSLRNRHDREAPPVPPPPTLFSLLFTTATYHCTVTGLDVRTLYNATVECWYRPAISQGFLLGSMTDLDYQGHSIGHIENNVHGKVHFSNAIYYDNHSPTPALDTWHHAALTWPTGWPTLWIDGQTQNKKGPQTHSYDQTITYALGGRDPSTWLRYAGNICRARVSDIIRYTTSFSPATDFTPDANTVALWRMTEGTGTTVADESGNGHTLDFPATNKPTWSNLVP